MKIQHLLKNGLLNLLKMLIAIAAVTATAAPVTNDWSWLTTTDIPHERVTQALNEIWQKPAAEAVTVADQLRRTKASSSQEDGYATGLFIAVALEHTGELDQRGDDLSVRFFRFLWSYSPFPKPYAYLFILLVLTLAVKFLELPFLFKTAKFVFTLPSLRDEMQSIRDRYSNDPQTANRMLAELFRVHGISPGSGCAVAIIDLIFVIWALIALSNFSPQFALDGARFYNISDVTQYNFNVIILWLCLGYFQFMVTGASQAGPPPGQVSCGIMLNSAIIGVIAWYWDWPAYVFIFWILLNLVSMLVNLILRGIWAAAR